MKISNMEYGINKINLSVIKIDEREGKDRRLYSEVTCVDGINTIVAKVWKSKTELNLEPPVVVEAMMEKQLYGGNDSYIMKQYVQRNDNPVDYMPHAPINPDVIFDDIMRTVFAFKDKSLKTVTWQILNKNKELFFQTPAAKAIHHNYIYGLMYHEYRMLQLAKSMVALYPEVNKDLLYASVLLHDIGKIKELSIDTAGVIDYTVAGNLLGHIIIGIQMIERECYIQGIDPESEPIRLLEHMLASHHGDLDKGAVVNPRTTEAMLLHEIDMIESRKWQYEKVEAENEEGTLSAKVFGLGNIPIYHPKR